MSLLGYICAFFLIVPLNSYASRTHIPDVEAPADITCSKDDEDHQFEMKKVDRDPHEPLQVAELLAPGEGEKFKEQLKQNSAPYVRIKIFKNTKIIGAEFAVVTLEQNGVVKEWDAFPMSTGEPHSDGGNYTADGIYTVTELDKDHRSSFFPKDKDGKPPAEGTGAPMPFALRITKDGVWIHVGHVTGKLASHGCGRVPGNGFEPTEYSKGNLLYKLVQQNKMENAVVEITSDTTLSGGSGSPSLDKIRDRVMHPEPAKDLNFGVAANGDMRPVTDIDPVFRSTYPGAAADIPVRKATPVASTEEKKKNGGIKKILPWNWFKKDKDQN